MEDILIKWFEEARAINIPVNYMILRGGGSLKITDRLVGLNDFTSSNGWIDLLKKDNLVYTDHF